MTRLSWSPDGDRLLAVQDGEIRVFDLASAEDRRLPGRGYFDARWLANGGVIASDRPGRLVRFTLHGEPYDAELELPAMAPRSIGCLSREGRVMALAGSQYGIWFELANDLRYRSLSVESIAPAFVTLADDATHVAATYQIPAWRRIGRAAARGWLVAAIDVFVEPPIGTVLLDRRRVEEGEAPSLVFAFDRKARRIGVAGDERGVFRLAGDGALDAPPDTDRAHAVALDERGQIAAYALDAGAVRIDYLDPATSGPRRVAVVDAMTIATDLGEIRALAFDPTSRMIACLSPANAIEIVPVL